MKKSVAIAGGGIAGLSAAVFLAEKGFKIKLFESSPKLGGRAYSFYDRDRKMFFDNGQHLLAGWYKNTFDFLKIIGTYNDLKFQSNLEIDFLDTYKQKLKLKSSGLRPPFNLLSALLSFPGFTGKEKLSVLKLRALMNGKSFDNFSNTAELLDSLGQTGNLMKYFWEPFILAVFNTAAKNVSVNVFMNVISKGFSDENGFKLVIPSNDLNQLLIDRAEEYLLSRGNEIEKSVRIVGAVLNSSDDHFITEDTRKIKADHFISAVPFHSFRGVFGNTSGPDHICAERLRSSSIVSVHIFLKDNCNLEFLKDNPLGMTGLIGTKIQWIFKKSESYFSVVISGADELGVTELSSEEIADLCIEDLEKCLNGFSGEMIKDYKVIKEKRATFIPDNESDSLRPKQLTGIKNFYIAGDWTDTGLPSTIESAIQSARICSDHICKTEGI
ncbi:MAG: hydroxysqualene dehydroxylase HpnE [Ignavibacteria bacterium]